MIDDIERAINKPDFKATLRWYFSPTPITLVTAPMFLALTVAGALSTWRLILVVVRLWIVDPIYTKLLVPLQMVGPAAVMICVFALPVIWTRLRAIPLVRAVVIAVVFVATLAIVILWGVVERAILEFVFTLW